MVSRTWKGRDDVRKKPEAGRVRGVFARYGTEDNAVRGVKRV